jgi:hypothetical protein
VRDADLKVQMISFAAAKAAGFSVIFVDNWALEETRFDMVPRYVALAVAIMASASYCSINNASCRHPCAWLAA